MINFNLYAVANKRSAIITASALALLTVSISIYKYTKKYCPFFNSKSLQSVEVNDTSSLLANSNNIELLESEKQPQLLSPNQEQTNEKENDVQN